MLSSVTATARHALIGICAGVLVLGASATVVAEDTVEPTTGSLSASELNALSMQAWNENDKALLTQVYAPDAVHTATFHDVTREYEGLDAISSVAMLPYRFEGTGPVVEIPTSGDDLRWASYVDLAGGTPCLFRAVNDQIVRQDCVLDERSTDDAPRSAAVETPSFAVVDLAERSRNAWNTSDRAMFDEAYAIDAVHTARFLDKTRRYEGRDAVADVAMLSVSPVTPIGQTVEFEAPEGELAWASVVGIGGGTLCRFHAVEGQITRHDCIVPVMS